MTPALLLDSSLRYFTVDGKGECQGVLIEIPFEAVYDRPHLYIANRGYLYTQMDYYAFKTERFFNDSSAGIAAIILSLNRWMMLS